MPKAIWNNQVIADAPKIAIQRDEEIAYFPVI